MTSSLNFLFRVFSGGILLFSIFGNSGAFASTTPTPCSTQTVYWGTISPWSSVACKGTVYGPAPSGNGGITSNTNPGYTGAAKVTCNNGKWVVSGTCTKVTSGTTPTATGSNPNTSSRGSGAMMPSVYGTNTPSSIASSGGLLDSGTGACIRTWNEKLLTYITTCPTRPISNSGGIQTREVTICYFTGSTTPQTCSTYAGNSQYSCSGIGYCKVLVSGLSGTKLTWKSTLGGYGYTTLDGKDEKVVFAKSPMVCPLYQVANPPPGCRYEYTKDTNGCSFPKMVCTNTGMMIPPPCSSQYIPVCGQPSFSCPSGAYCAQVMPQPKTYSNRCEMEKVGATFLYNGACMSTGTGVVPPPVQTKEMVTCVFSGSTTTQKCSTYAGTGNLLLTCSGVSTCSIPVYGMPGSKFVWKSTLGGYGYTTLDGKDEKIVFINPTQSFITTTNTNGPSIQSNIPSSQIESFRNRFNY